MKAWIEKASLFIKVFWRIKNKTKAKCFGFNVSLISFFSRSLMFRIQLSRLKEVPWRWFKAFVCAVLARNNNNGDRSANNVFAKRCLVNYFEIKICQRRMWGYLHLNNGIFGHLSKNKEKAKFQKRSFASIICKENSSMNPISKHLYGNVVCRCT